MKTFIPPDFSKEAKKAGIKDKDLRSAISRAERGIIDAQLGAHLIKQRIPRQGQGRSGGFRSIIAYKRGKVAVPLYVFPKNAKANLTKKETADYLAAAEPLVGLSDDDFARLISERGWRQINDEQPEKDVPE